MTPALILIGTCLIGALTIELRANYLMRKIIDRHVSELNLAHSAPRAKRPKFGKRDRS